MSNHVAVGLAVRRSQVEVFSNETSKTITSHIGLQPHALLKAQNSLYSIEFTRRYNQICTQMNAVISAHACSKMMAKEGVVGGKIGVLPSHSCIRFYDTQFKTDLSLSILSSVQSDNILNHHIKTTALEFSGENYGERKFMVQALQHCIRGRINGVALGRTGLRNNRILLEAQ